MTRLTKVVRREAARTAEQGRPIIIALEPAPDGGKGIETLAMRQKGLRKWYRLSLGSLFWQAVKADALAIAKARAQARRERRVAQ